MKIITWNVRISNRKVQKLIQHAWSYNPDIVCLQEVPEVVLPYLHATYHTTYTYDSASSRPGKNRFICTLSKIPPVNTVTRSYAHQNGKSLMTTVLYSKVLKIMEQRRALITQYQHGSNRYQIVNARLSCAVGVLDRLNQFMTILQNIDIRIPTAICGDLNIIDMKIINILTGWMRGFRLIDYVLNERLTFESICEQFDLVNIFRSCQTWALKWPLIQPDHILVPAYTKVANAYIHPKRFGSDHRMLLADILFPNNT